MLRICQAFFAIPQVMGNKFEERCFGRRPGRGRAGGRKRPGLQLGEIGGQGA